MKIHGRNNFLTFLKKLTMKGILETGPRDTATHREALSPEALCGHLADIGHLLWEIFTASNEVAKAAAQVGKTNVTVGPTEITTTQVFKTPVTTTHVIPVPVPGPLPGPVPVPVPGPVPVPVAVAGREPARVNSTIRPDREYNTVGRGLANPTSTNCFLNAVMQALAYTPAVQEKIRSWKSPCGHEFVCGPGILHEDFRKMFESFAEGQERVISPDIYKSIHARAPGINMARQSDAHEALVKVLKWLKNTPCGDYIPKQFEFQLEQWKQCSRCTIATSIETTEQQFYILSPPNVLAKVRNESIYEKESMQARLDKSFRSWTFGPQDGKTSVCGMCDVNATERYQIGNKSLPKIAMLVRPPGTLGTKDESEIDAAPVIHMKAGTSDKLHSYALKSAIVHHGSVPETGHYTALVKVNTPGESTWFEFNDSKVVGLPAKNAKELADKAYIWFYEKC